MWPTSWPAGNALSPSPADRVRMLLLDDSSLSNREVALMARITIAQVERVRRSMIDVGLLMPRRVVPTHARFKQLPRSPRVLAEGLCVGHPNADAWTSDDWHERQLAIEVCRSCHVINARREFSLTLPAKDKAIWAGMTASQRDRLRRRREGRPEPGWVTDPNFYRRRRQARQRARERDRPAAAAAREAAS
jgi:hypothetical protein